MWLHLSWWTKRLQKEYPGDMVSDVDRWTGPDGRVWLLRSYQMIFDIKRVRLQGWWRFVWLTIRGAPGPLLSVTFGESPPPPHTHTHTVVRTSKGTLPPCNRTLLWILRVEPALRISVSLPQEITLASSGGGHLRQVWLYSQSVNMTLKCSTIRSVRSFLGQLMSGIRYTAGKIVLKIPGSITST